jgi:hypothetical protein
VHHEIQPPEFAIEQLGEKSDLLIVRNVARRDDRPLELLSQLAHVLFQPLGRVGER